LTTFDDAQYLEPLKVVDPTIPVLSMQAGKATSLPVISECVPKAVEYPNSHHRSYHYKYGHNQIIKCIAGDVARGKHVH